MDQISEESQNQALAIYKIYILVLYLGNWISETLSKVDNNTTTVNKLYGTIIGGKANTNIQQLSSKQRKLPDEKPELISKRLSALKRKRPLRSRSLRDGSLTYKDCFEVFVRSSDSFNIRFKNSQV